MSQSNIQSLVAILNGTTIDYKNFKTKLEEEKKNISYTDYIRLINGNNNEKESECGYKLTSINGYKGWCLKSIIDYHYTISKRISEEDYSQFKSIMNL
jgi:hypothetical protein